MTRFVGNPLRGVEFANPSDEAISARVTTDPHARIRIDAGGRITWSSGSAAGDVNLYRSAADTLTTDDVLKATGGVVTLVTAGAPSVALSDGALAVDSTNDVLYIRSGGEWIQVKPTLSLDELSDVDLTVAPNDGDFLKYSQSASAWVSGSVQFAATLDELTDVNTTGAENGEFLQYDGTQWVPSTFPSVEPIGHENKADSVISFDESTRMFTIAPASTSFTVWCTGKRYVKTTTQTVTIPDTSGLYYIYFDNVGNLAYKTTFFTWDQDTPTAYIYWNADDNKAYFFADERHGVTLDWQTHEYLHRTRGASIASGFGASAFDVEGDGSLDSHAKIDLANGTFFDEDLQVDISHSASPAADTWEQRIQGGAYIPIFRRQNNHWVKDVATQFPLKQGTLRAQYNLNTAGTWSSVDIDQNKFGISWIVATNNLNEPILGILGQGSYNTLGEAEAVGWDSLNLDNFPVFEFRPLHKIIYETATGYSNTPHARFSGVYDLRRVVSGGDQAIPTTPVSDHGSMTGLSDDDHLQYLNVARHDAHDHSAAMTTVVLDDISNVSASAPAVGQSLTWDGTAWVPGEGGGGATVTVSTTAPLSPEEGDLWYNSETTSMLVYYDSSWIEVAGGGGGGGGGGASVTVSDTAPSSPGLGDLWFESDTGATFIWYDGVWIEVGAAGDFQLDTLQDVGDVLITAEGAGDFLKWNGTNWVNDAVNLGTDTVGSYVEYLTAGTDIVITNNSGEGSHPTISASVQYLNNVGDVTITSLQSGQFLKSDGSAWINDYIDLGADTVGDYVESLVAGTGIIITDNSGEGSNPTIAIGQNVSTTSSVSFAHVNAPVTGDVVGNVTGNLVGNAATATTLQTARTIGLSGDVSGSASFDGSANVTITTTVEPNSVALGTDTTGAYVQSLVAGTGVTLANNSGENATPTVSIGQDVSTSASVTFQNLTVTGDLVVSGTTTTLNTTELLVEDNIITLNSNVSASPIADAGLEVERGTQPTVTLKWNETIDKWQFTNDGVNYIDLGAGAAEVSQTAPSVPEEGTLWFDSTSAKTYVYYDSYWVEIGASTGNGVSITTSDSSPATAVDGDMWFDSSTAKTYIYFDASWIEIGAYGSGGGGGGTSVSVSETAPALPLEGDLWFNSGTAQTFIYYDSSWVEISGGGGGGGGGASVTISETAPVDPEEGDMWFNSSSAQTFIYYDSSWIELGGSGMAAIVADTAPASPINGQIWFNSSTGGTYVYYGTDSVWIEIGASPASSIVNNFEAKGDLLVGTGSATYDNLAVGTNGTVLLSASAQATGLAWGKVGATNMNLLYADQSQFPSATDNHGSIVHSHADGKMYYAHAGSWVAIPTATEVQAKASTGKAIAMAIVFGG